MKRVFYILSAILFSTAVAYGQKGDNKIKYGVRSGLNYSTLIYEFEDSNQDFLDFKSKAGFYIGGFLAIHINDKFSVQPELIYSSQGAKLDVDLSQLLIFDNGDDPTFINNSDVSDINLKQNNFLIPILLSYKATEHLNLYLGPQITYLLKFENELEEDGNSLETVRLTDNDKVGIDINARIGYSIYNNISLELGYFRSLNNLNSLKSSVFQLGLSYQF